MFYRTKIGYLLVSLEDDIEVPLGNRGVVLARPLDSDWAVHLEGREEGGLGNVPGHSTEENLLEKKIDQLKHFNLIIIKW